MKTTLHGVLAAAYPRTRNPRLLTHVCVSAETPSGLRTLCGRVKAEHICDEEQTPSVDAPLCRRCAALAQETTDAP